MPELLQVWPGDSISAMPVTTARARKIMLALANVSEAPHFDRTAFRTPRKIFATMAPDGKSINLTFTPDLQEFWCEHEPSSFAPVAGGWGRMGYTTCVLAKVDEAVLKSALVAAHEIASAPPKKKPRKR